MYGYKKDEDTETRVEKKGWSYEKRKIEEVSRSIYGGNGSSGVTKDVDLQTEEETV